MSLFLVGLDITGGVRRVAVDRARPGRRDLLAAMDDRRLHHRHGEPAHLRGVDGRPDRPQARLRHRPRGVHLSRRCCAALPPRSSCWWHSVCYRRFGGCMLNPVAMSIITNTFTEPRERAQAVSVSGRGVRDLDGARSDRRRRARLLDRVARDLLAQHPGRARRDGLDAAVRPRVQGAAPAALRSRRPDPRLRAAGVAHVRDHRGTQPRVDVADDPRCVHGVGRGIPSGCCSTRHPATSR